MFVFTLVVLDSMNPRVTNLNFLSIVKKNQPCPQMTRKLKKREKSKMPPLAAVALSSLLQMSNDIDAQDIFGLMADATATSPIRTFILTLQGVLIMSTITFTPIRAY